MKDEKISSLQVVMLFTGYLLGTSIVLNPSVKSGPDAWFSVLVSFLGGLFLASLTATLALLYPGKSLTEIMVACFGIKAGKAVSFAYLLYAVWLSGSVTRDFSFYAVTMDFSETPLPYISIGYILVIAFVVKMGLEAMGRISEVFLFLIGVITIITLLSLFESFHPDAFSPMFAKGWAKPATAGLTAASIPYGEIVLALNILPNLNDQKRSFRCTITSVFITGAFLMLFCLRNTCVLGPDVTAQNVYPDEKVFRLMPGINVLALLDIKVMVTGVLKVCVALYSQVRMFGDLFGFKEFKLFVLPFAALDLVMSLFISNSMIAHLFAIYNIVPLLYIPILVVAPVVFVTAALARAALARRQRKSSAPKM